MNYDRQKPLSDNEWMTYSHPLQQTYNSPEVNNLTQSRKCLKSPHNRSSPTLDITIVTVYQVFPINNT